EIIGRFAGNISENYFLKNLFPAKPLYFSAKPTGVLLVGCAICILAVAPPLWGKSPLCERERFCFLSLLGSPPLGELEGGY
ncbi:MAG: hypothetical protein MJZ54_07160, partial [Bacteroidaceae bacterium]|nr:hypothetical protein [Bacteroidaceae bacterium]